MPTLDYVLIYFNQKEVSGQIAVRFYNECNKSSWRTGIGLPIKNWRTYASKWLSLQKNQCPKTLVEKICLSESEILRHSFYEIYLLSNIDLKVR